MGTEKVFQDTPPPPNAHHGVLGVSTSPIGCDTPPPPFSEPFPLESMRSGGAISPQKKGYLSDMCAIPHENIESTVCILGAL